MIGKSFLSRGARRIVLLLLLSAPLVTWANGGPINWTELMKTGRVEFQAEQDFVVESESVVIKLTGDHAQVAVEYEIRNGGPARDVPYAFPIDVAAERGDFSFDAIEDETIDFSVFADGKRLEFERGPVDERRQVPYPSIWEAGSTQTVWAARGYYVGVIAFDGNETKVIRVEYTVQVQLLDMVTTSSFVPHFSDRILVYDLRPAGNWGNGRVGRFSLEIDLVDVHRVGGEALTLPFDGTFATPDRYVFTATDFDLRSAGDLVIRYTTEDYLMTRFFEEQRLPEANIVSISASSTLEPGARWSYASAHLLDLDMETVWVEGVRDEGVGEYIEIEFRDFSVAYIGIVNGFVYSEEFYRDNGRVRQIRYQIERDPNAAYLSDGGVIEEWRALKDLGYAPVTQANYAALSQPIFVAGEAGIPATKLTIWIEDTFPGERYEDTCITEIIILGYGY